MVDAQINRKQNEMLAFSADKVEHDYSKGTQTMGNYSAMTKAQ
jgi:hypothetical protein